MSSQSISETKLASIPNRRSRKNVVVLKFGGTTVGATPEQGRIRLARDTIRRLIEDGRFVVPVFSAYRRGRSGAKSKISVTDILENHHAYVSRHETFETGVEVVGKQLFDAHFDLIDELGLVENEALTREIRRDIEWLKSSITMSCTAYEPTPSLNDMIITAGERLAVKIISAYLNQQHFEGKFPLETAPVTAMELGIYTDNQFGSATINWPRAIDHSREVIIGQYLERDVMPVVTGFDGIYDPENEFKEIMQTAPEAQKELDRRYSEVYRTSLGRGGSDLTATFLGLALDAEYVGFCKETPGVLTGDDLLVGQAAQTVPELDYDLATEAGNIYSRAVEPVRHGQIPVHLFDPAVPDQRTVIADISLPAGLYIIERPMEAINIHTRSIPDEPGSLLAFLKRFADKKINVEEIRHQRSGTDCIVHGDEEVVQTQVDALNKDGFQSQAHYTWYLRVVGNVTEQLSSKFNRFMYDFEPLTLSTYQLDTKVVTATVARNRAGDQLDEMERVEELVRRIHDAFVVRQPAEPSLGPATTQISPALEPIE